MKHLLLICQPLNNRGDESAHKGLLRAISKESPQTRFTVVFLGNKQNSIDQFNVKLANVEYVNIKGHKGLIKFISYIAKYNMIWLSFLLSPTRNLIKYYKKSDAVMCAPGGMNMGGFQSWNHLYWLKLAVMCKKPLYYYGRSIGPFPIETKDQRKFRNESRNILDYISFLSLRDKKSEEEALKIGVKNYYSTLDSAFLDSPKVIVPNEIQTQIGDKPYIVFVPNILIWHHAYKGKASKTDIINYYVKMVTIMMSRFPDYNIVMLPQTFNYDVPLRNDVNLFKDIKSVVQDKRIIVVEDIYSSDIQQTIISKCQFLVGARYHSIVFAINQAVPFIALCYEHKIEGLLQALNKTDCMIDITKIFDNSDNAKRSIVSFEKLLSSMLPDSDSQKRAKCIANDCLEKYLKIINQ
jgi:colanic acid/amylovoran biosynthesis protein